MSADRNTILNRSQPVNFDSRYVRLDKLNMTKTPVLKMSDIKLADNKILNNRRVIQTAAQGSHVRQASLK